MDIGLTTGEDLIQQRILLRLIMMRGWIYDTTGELGSNLWSSMDQPTIIAAQDIPSLVLEALAPMDREITVTNVVVTELASESSVIVIVEYTRTGTTNIPTVQRITFPLIR